MSTAASESPIRVLVIAEKANPEWTSVPLVGWSLSKALGGLVSTHVVTHVRNEDAFLRAGVPREAFTAIDSERVAKVIWRLSELLRGGKNKGWTTVMALSTISYYYFERLVWAQFRERIVAGEFDIVHRVTPLSPTTPSLLAKKCAKAGVKFVLGPLNGGVPWPKGFDSVRRQEREWLSYVREAYKLVPGYRSTRKHASAIVVGSRDTFKQVSRRYQDKCVYVPENAIEPDRFTAPPQRSEMPPMRVAFIGRLVPYKGADMLLEAAAPLVREKKVVVDIIGDGPQMPELTAIVEREGIGDGVSFRGMVEHSEVQTWLGRAHVLGFPSIREFGGGVVLEAMVLGVVPVIVDYGGPGELVTASNGFKIPMGTRSDIVDQVRRVLTDLHDSPQEIKALSERARSHVLRWFTWHAKAQQMVEIYRWMLGRRSDKPDFGMPFGS